MSKYSPARLAITNALSLDGNAQTLNIPESQRVLSATLVNTGVEDLILFGGAIVLQQRETLKLEAPEGFYLVANIQISFGTGVGLKNASIIYVIDTGKQCQAQT